MRKVAIVTAIALAVLVWAAINLRWLPQSADAASPMAGAMTAYAIQAKIDVQALPVQNILSEAEE